MSSLSSRFQKLFGLETKGALSAPEGWLLDLFGAAPAVAGVSVSPRVAMTCAPVHCAVQAISEAIGLLPVHTFTLGADGAKTPDTDHPAYTLLHDAANEWTSASQFREDITRDALLYPHGGFAFINRVDDKPFELIRYNPEINPVAVQYVDSEPFYRVGDTMTAVAATVALLIADKPAVAFTFNLTPDAVAKAKDSPTGFLDSLKRSFDLELKRLLPGVTLPYWFCIDIEEGRLHIHGAFLSPTTNLPMVRRITKVMKAAWGEWEGLGKHKQLRFKTLYSDDWATYCFRNQRAVSKVIGPRTFTINQALRRDAEWTYGTIRRIMRCNCPDC